MDSGREDGRGQGKDESAGGRPLKEFDVYVSQEGMVVFSWNSPGIQELAEELGIPEFPSRRWCG